LINKTCNEQLGPIISSTNMNTLQIIQNSALRIILRKPIMTKTRISELHEISKLEYIKERFYSLNQRYITKAIVNKNPMIAQVIEEYQRYKEYLTVKLFYANWI